MKTFEEVLDIAAGMIETDEELCKLYDKIDRIFNCEWSLPPGLDKIEHMRKYTSDDPYKAVEAGTRSLSSVTPRPMIDPITVYKAVSGKPNIKANKMREKANEWERVLMWQWKLAENRNVSLLSDLVRSAMLYDSIRAQVIYLPDQMASVAAAGGNTNRYEAALRHGDFALKVYHPSAVHVRRSVYGVEAVLVATQMSAQEIVDTYGELAADIKALLGTPEEPENMFLFDMTDMELRCVWAVRATEDEELTKERVGSKDGKDGEDIFKIVSPEERKNRPFIPWVALDGGTSLFSKPENQHHPMLYSIAKTGSWETTNVIGTIMSSDPIAKASQPTIGVTGPNPDDVDIDYTDPANIIRMRTGTTAQKFPKDGLDPAQRELWQQFKGELAESSNAKVLMNAEMSAGQAYSAFDLQVKIATRSLFPFRSLGGRAVGAILETMLLWAHYTGHDIEGYGTKKSEKVKYYCIKEDDIDPNCLYVSAELQEDVPTDRQQRINGASMMKRDGLYPDSKILEELGDTDPEGTLEEMDRQTIRQTYMAARNQLMMADVSGQIQQMAQELAQQMYEQMMKQQEQQAAAQPEGDPMAEALGDPGQDLQGGMGMPGVEGEGFAPGMGGQPPAMANPAGNVREQQTGMSAAGEELG